MRRLLAVLLLLALAAPAAGMDTILTARANSAASGGVVRWAQLMGNYTALADSLYSYTWMSSAGTVKDFNFLVSAAPGSGQADTLTVYKNTTAQFTTIISGTSTTAAPSNSFTVVAGDYVRVRCAASAGATGADLLFYSTFTGSTAGQSIVTGGSGSTTNSTTANRYAGLMGVSTFSATANDMRQVMPTGGTFSNLYVSANTALTSGSYAVNLYVNGSATALTASLTNSGTTASDVTHSVAVSAGDLVEIETVPSSPNATKRIQWGLRWTPTTDGEGLLIGGSLNDLNQTTSEFNVLNNSSGTWSTSESTFQSYWPAVELKKFYTTLSAAPNTGNNYAFTIRDDGAGSALTLTISDAATTGSDLSHTVTPGAGSLMCLGVVPTSTPDVADAYWGLVAYIAPPAGTTKRVMVIP